MSEKLAFALSAWILGIFTARVFAANSMNLNRIRRNEGVTEFRAAVDGSPLMLYDFTDSAGVDNWNEISDTVRDVGMSKASFVIQHTQRFRRAIFFSLLNPQVNGAGFAGVKTPVNLDLSGFTKIELRGRAQGNKGYKIVLRHKGQEYEPFPTYENFFEGPEEFSTISLSLDDFKPYYRGRQLNSTEAEPLDVANITSIGLQIYGGVYSPIKQKGPSAFELDWIRAV
ncbi:hypothetical protein J437_LFUL017726 [Ladona fulva]|uniref:NADH:ubiquinone oxidoreductase intermediate-associated protein 30 domain-containing protein n=1 Tax=Ladona fulva TaxID=123851 RepID=A0A8K0P5K0_LADFU|nr:hypothetical protein J437_LFUL017726 [Ladona fulva]